MPLLELGTLTRQFGDAVDATVAIGVQEQASYTNKDGGVILTASYLVMYEPAVLI